MSGPTPPLAPIRPVRHARLRDDVARAGTARIRAELSPRPQDDARVREPRRIVAAADRETLGADAGAGR